METVKFSALDPTSLTDDEVVYELRVRGVFNQQHNQAYRRSNLKKYIDDELKNRTMMPTQLQFEKSDAVSELQCCRNKVTELATLIGAEDIKVWRDRAAHVKNRLKRLASVLPSENAACAKVFNDLAETIRSCETNYAQQHQGAGVSTPSNMSFTAQPQSSKSNTPTSSTTTTTTSTTTNTSHSGPDFIQQFSGANFVTTDALTTAMQRMTTQFAAQIRELTTQMHQVSQQLNDLGQNQQANHDQLHSTPRQHLNFDLAAPLNNSQLPHNVTVVPYGQTPVSKWQIKFSGLPKKDDSKSITDVNIFLERVEELMEAHRVLNAEIVEKLNLLLLGPAHSYMTELKRQGVVNWSIIKTKFRKRFANMTEENLRHEIYSRKQKQDERTLDFMYEMCDLIGRLPTPVDEPTRIQMVFRGMDAEVARLARARNVLTIDELSNYIVDTFGCEDSPANRITQNRPRPFSRFNYPKSYAATTSCEGEAVEDDVEANEFEMLAAHRFLSKWQKSKANETKDKKEVVERVSESAAIVCWNCDQGGHGLQSCPKKRTRLICYGCGKKDETVLSCPKCSKSIKTTDNNASVTTATPDADEFDVVYDINNLIYEPPNDSRPHASVKMNSIEFVGLLDTGAHVTVIGLNHMAEEEKRSVLNWMVPTNIGIRTADNTIHKAIGMLKSEYSYHGRVCYVQTIVMPKTSKKLLLGMDFMKTFNIRLMDWEFIKEEMHQMMWRLSNRTTADRSAKPLTDNAQAAVLEANAFDVVIIEDTTQRISSEHHMNEIEFSQEFSSASMALSQLDHIAETKIETLAEEECEWIPKKHESVFEAHVLTLDQQQQLNGVLEKFPWTPTTGRLNHTTKYIHTIDTGDEKPVSQRQFNMSPYVERKVGEELQRMLERGIIRRISHSEWLNRIVPVRKKDDTMRICLDARELNKRTKKSTYPQTDMNRILSRLQKTKYLSALDLGEAFFQIKLSNESSVKTAFAIAPFGYFCFDRMPMGCVNSSAALCALVDSVFGVQFEGKCFWYVDDFLIASETFEEHLATLELVASKLIEAELSISKKKSKFCMRKLRFLGMIISEAGIEVDNAKIEAIDNIKRPVQLKQLQSFLGMTGFFRRFIDGYSQLAAPLSEMTKGQNKMLSWNDDANKAFEMLKSAMKSAPILATPQYDQPFVIECDSSDWCAGSVLMQYVDGQPKVISYFSMKYTPAQRKYSTTEKECLSVILSIEKFRPYIDMVRFTVVTDHASLLWLCNLKDATGRLARWALRLQCYDIDFVHRPGKEHKVPDMLSRSLDLIDTELFVTTQDKWYLQLLGSTLPSPPSNLKVIDGILYRKIDTITSDREWKMCVPLEARTMVLKQEHDDVLAAHPGFFKTLRRIQLKYYWPSMSQDISKYVRECDVCRACKASNENTTTPMLTNRYAKFPGQIVAIDYIGPYPRSKEGYRFAVVAIDSFTKFTFAQTLRDASAAATIKFLKREIMFKHFVPEKIVSDNGPQFRSNIFKQMLEEFNIVHWRTAYYNPQANASECANKSIINGIRAYIEEKFGHSGWANHFDEIICAINTSPHSATKVTPYFAMYGREMVLDAREYKTILNANVPHHIDVDRLAIIRDQIQTHLNEAFKRNQKQYNLRAVERQFKEGDFVWVTNHKQSSAASGFSQKLAPRKIKAVIAKKLGENTYQLTTQNGVDLGVHPAKHIFMV